MTTSSSPVAVVGCGLMGSGIAEVLARAGRPVLVHEVDDAAAQRGRARIEASLSRAVRNGKLDEAGSDEVLGRIEIGTDLDALAHAELVVEAASEDEAVKTELFRRLDTVLVREDAVPGLQHVVDPDHEAGHRHEAPGAGRRPALLQPRPRARAGRGGPVAAHRRRDRRSG